MIYKLNEPERALKIFEGWEESMIWSCLEDVMGVIYVDEVENPQSAAAALADFVFLDGEPNRELIQHDYGRNYVIMTARDPRWDALIQECYGEQAKPIIRYAIQKEPGVFNTEQLKRYAADLPEGMELRYIDEELYNWAKQSSWADDWIHSYSTYEEYAAKGLGVCLLKDGEPVAGASSYISYKEGIEIQIDTHKDYRQQGLATICGAAIILACLERGWYPSWDAANIASVRLAEKLGYHLDHEYTAWDVFRKQSQ